MTRRIVITGGGTGIGLAVARRLLPDRPELHLVGRRGDVLEAAAAELRAEADGATVVTHVCDLTDPAAVEVLAAELTAGGSIDVLVANAGGRSGRTAEGLAGVAEAWQADFVGNTLTTVLIGEALLPHLARPGGRVVAISSLAALRGSGSYGGAKAAVHAWALSAATAVAADGVTVNCVAPGFVPETDFWRARVEADPAVWESRVAPIPMGRPGTAAEVAEAVAHLASPGAGWTTGQILQVNGGTLLGRG